MRFILCSLLFTCLTLLSQTVEAQRPRFSRGQDLFLAQYDMRPDPDDVHSLAALGSMFVSGEQGLTGINAFGVQGSIGSQRGSQIRVPALFNLVFGSGNWADALGSNRGRAVRRVRRLVVATIRAGGRVWVQEAGQSDFTASWLRQVIDRANGIGRTRTRSQVVVVQHQASFNEGNTSPANLRFVMNNTDYTPIDDGNARFGRGTNRGPNTGQFLSNNTRFIARAISDNNTRFRSRRIWRLANRLLSPVSQFPDFSSITVGGVDYSDCSEALWIFSRASSITTNEQFWSRFVTNVPN